MVTQNVKEKSVDKFRYVDPSETQEVSSSITQNWTDQAIRCFYHKSDCTKCTITKGNYSFECQMASIVDILIKEHGIPNKEKIWKSIVKAN